MGRPDAPRVDFGGRNAWIFEVFRASRPLTVKSPTQGGDTAKTVVFAAPDACKIAPNALLTRDGDKVALRACSGASWERPGPSTWRPRRPTWRPRRSTWRPRRPNMASQGRSERVPARLRIDLERPKRPKNVFSSIFPRSNAFFRRFFVDFSLIFCRFVRRPGLAVRAPLQSMVLRFRSL